MIGTQQLSRHMCYVELASWGGTESQGEYAALVYGDVFF